MDLPYRTDYAKSSRSICRGCHLKIDQDVLRLGIMEQCMQFDGKIPRWYHFTCFFNNHRPNTVGDIDRFEYLRWKDQEKIKSIIEASLSEINVGKEIIKRDASAVTVDKASLKDFTLTYSKSDWNSCYYCKQWITKEEIIASRRCGDEGILYHLTCFGKVRAELEQSESGNKPPIFKRLNENGQQALTKRQRKTKHKEVPPKKAKITGEAFVSKSQDAAMRAQNELFFEYRDQLKCLPEYALRLLLRANKQVLPYGKERMQKMLDRVADIMTFGALERCTGCGYGQLEFGKFGYMCQSYSTEWSKCNMITKTPRRHPFVVPRELAEQYTFLGKYKYVKRSRIIKDVNPTNFGQPQKHQSSICNWRSDTSIRSPPKLLSDDNSELRGAKKKLRAGNAVDPDSGLEGRAHIYHSGRDKYSAVLGLTDIQRKINKYYILQLLQANSEDKYWLFRSWGRIGTSIGGNRVEEMSLFDAEREFCHHYKEKSGNEWFNRHHFAKVPGLMYPIDVDGGEEDAELERKLEKLSVPSILAERVQQLIELIFNVNSMKKVMQEFKLDVERMPLGKLSKSQLQNAYTVLSELQVLVTSRADLPSLIDASNRFYTFVPHSFGVDDPPVINNRKVIAEKVEMIDSLMQLETAYSLIKSVGSSSKNILDHYYEQLKTDIDILPCESEEFAVIKDYVKNTHAVTHSTYKLEIQEVFTVKRHGEEKRYQPFRKLHNRKLLWHGSRTTNFAGILSQGLRIAPPEAPASGYMFGKGIYFADMVSKSANYCLASPEDSTGLLLLCEVALGNMYEIYDSKDVKKLPRGKNSVKGLGRTVPNPKDVKKLFGDVDVPVGNGIVMNKARQTSLLYNEYIIYNEAQVNIKYLVKVNFKYKT